MVIDVIASLLFNVICSTSHLVVLKVISHLLAHVSILDKSHRRALQLSADSIFLYIKQSSANKLQEEVIHSGRSLVYNRNNKGPNRVP